MAGPRDESVLDREPAGVRVMRPSRFRVVTLVVLLLLGCSLNLFFVHTDPLALPNGSQVLRKVRIQLWNRGLPTIPQDMIDQLGSFYVWERNDHVYHTEWSAIWLSTDANPPIDMPNYYFVEQRLGLPLTARSTKAVRYYKQSFTQTTLTEGTIWPEVGNVQVPPAVSYHPLGLILNPIIYALPIWLIVMGVRWAFISRRSRKRARLGVCVGCAYELAGLGVCPECGRERA